MEEACLMIVTAEKSMKNWLRKSQWRTCNQYLLSIRLYSHRWCQQQWHDAYVSASCEKDLRSRERWVNRMYHSWSANRRYRSWRLGWIHDQRITTCYWQLSAVHAHVTSSSCLVDDNVDERLMKGHSIREHFQGPYMMMMMIILMMLVMMKKAHNSESNHWVVIR